MAIDRSTEYAARILIVLNQMFDEDSEHFLDLRKESEDPTAFFHALANIAPNMLYQQITGETPNSLEFNHIANQLCFQYSKIEG